ncbi:MAG: CPBP family intramembrane metalloprotease [Alphaproteobacteria bacterium]|nr:CPBP family intramembrane metalloprotease [Alphaproteobacteria bacterium]MBL6936662.1 CPBP family intramembrane metalloprotease [Alphaproteobacteria bacterium]MBL7097431.1 CPBP family intramembrane metalloprotease [Alphaproteobacteria bacterium]
MHITLSHSEPAPRQHGVVRTVASAIGAGVTVIVVGEAVWLSLIAAYAHSPTPFPWFVLAMATFLAAAGAWLKWGRWPRAGAAARREGARLNAVPLRVFVLSLLAGWSSFFAGAGAYVAYRMQNGLSGEVPMTLPPGPKGAVLAGLAMAAIVAGTVEEVAVRGFMQSRLEKAYGVVPAILVSGLVWALFHSNHSYFNTSPGDVAVWFGVFLAVSAILGRIASLTNSVLPTIVVHAGFDAAYFVSAGILQPKIAPLTYLQTLASAQDFLTIGAGLAVLAAFCWVQLHRAVRRA